MDSRTRGPGLFRIGWAQSDITPGRPVNLFGMFNERISTHVEEPCFATALALESADGERAIWVSCDLVGVKKDVVQDLRAAAGARLRGFDPEKLFVSCTHTHNAPNFNASLFPPPPEGAMTPDEYREFFLAGASEAAVRAWGAREPGSVQPALGYAVLGWCRRAVYADGAGRMYGSARRDDFVKIEGPMDPGIELMFTRNAAGRLSGALISIACTAQTCMGSRFLTADFWGPARRMLRERFGREFMVLAVTGPAGDQCPDDLIRLGRSEPRRRGLEGAAELSRRLVNGVADALKNGSRSADPNPVFRHKHAVLDLPVHVMTPEQAAHYENLVASLTAKGEPDPGSWDGGTLLRARKRLERQAGLRSGSRVKADCNFLRVGDTAIATNPFELYLEYGQRIKGRSPAVQTISAELTNDSLGYLPTREAMAHGHYSAIPSNAGPEGGDLLVEHSVKHLEELWKE